MNLLHLIRRTSYDFRELRSFVVWASEFGHQVWALVVEEGEEEGEEEEGEEEEGEEEEGEEEGEEVLQVVTFLVLPLAPVS